MEQKKETHLSGQQSVENTKLSIKSVCHKCRFENECRFKAENVEQNCKFFIDSESDLDILK